MIVRSPLLVQNAGNDAELGIARSATEEVALSPVVVRNSNPQRETELLISAASLARAREIQDATSAREFFASAIGVIVEDRLFRIRFVQVDEVAGTPYLYRARVGE